MLQLHLGCGERYIPGFVHVDLAEHSHIDKQCDVRDLSFLEDKQVDLIYACHVLEYFDGLEVVDVLKEWRRVLKPGGILRLAVPDFSALIKVYELTGDLKNVLGPLYGRREIPGTKPLSRIYHKTVYDYESLRQILQSCGFKDVQRYDWRETIHKNHDDHSQAYFPHMDKENGLLISLNVETYR
ncbi:MAG TPA: methyltransferase domain-containing protein [Gammaproteobacteria bacterium]|nr:methyltransferase domain-containing protein [Gammaproteobacteria bacterium]HJP39419.1 methyltransferase domain-containing protein [Gammaproteobacteria bacterium]